MIKQEKNESVARSIMRPVEISAEDARVYEDNPRWESYPKLNGVFARWDPSRKKFFSKRGIAFKEHLIPELYRKYSIFKHAFDGEIWAPRITLQQICGALSHERDEPAPYHKHLMYVPFDAPYFGGPWTNRARFLCAHPEPTIIGGWLVMGSGFIDNENCDGKVFRYSPGIYQSGESGNVLKYKFWKDCELDVLRAERGTPTSSYHDVLGNLVCRFNNTTVSVGSGFSFEERAEFIHNPPSRIKIKYLSLSPDGIPLNPSYIGLDL
jgi:ATP-dependent DNA ligase